MRWSSSRRYDKEEWCMNPPERFPPDDPREWLNRARSNLASPPWEEIETWTLAGLDLPADWNWKTVRAEVQVKEIYFEPLVAQRNLSDAPGGGRKPLGEEASHRIDAIRQKCPEDFDALAQRLEAVI